MNCTSDYSQAFNFHPETHSQEYGGSSSSQPMSFDPSPQGSNEIENECNSVSQQYINGAIPNAQYFNTYGGLRSINEIPPKYRHIFSNYPSFNKIQSRVLDDVLHSDSSVVVSAPTGSGKTAIFELAIVQLLKKMDDMNYSQNFKIVYMAPVKALCTERFRDWDAKFSRYGLMCKEVTGDSYETDLLEISHCRLILTTPEKWDSLTRRWKDNRGLVQVVKLFLIDEVHLLNEERRGATLEAVVSRMKTVQKTLRFDRHTPSHTFLPLRFIAVSATIPNVEDVAQWLGCDDSPAKHYKISDELRPVKLNKVVIGYPCTTASPFQFDIGLSYKLKPILIKYSDLKPTLIFCSTRKGVQQTSSVLAQQLTFEFNQEQREKLALAANLIQENKLKALLKGGIGYHHAGMDLADRSATEQVFHSGCLPVLVTTSTLAMGVNLPAHLVIIKSTQQYVYGGYQEYSETQVLQMIGRAGRPQFDTSATAVIMTKDNTKHRYERLVDGKELVESSLHRHLTEHLNAEVVLQTITEHAVAMDWIRSTFLYVRALSNPRHYGFPANLDKRGIEYKLEQMCLIELNELSKAKLITIDLINISPTETGCLMARYYLAFESMKIFAKVCGSEKLQELLSLLSECHEFSDVQLRVNEKKTLNALNKTKDQECIRFPLPGRIKTRDMKVNCLIQAVFGGLQIYDTSLNQDATKIVRAGERVSKCLVQFLNQQSQYQSLLSAIILAKCFYRKLWENTPYVSRQLERIGPALSSLLAKNGKTSFRAIVESNPRDLERILNRPPPMGNRIQEAVRGLPYFSLDLEASDQQFARMTVTVKLLNPELVLKINMSSNEHCFTLLVGDSENRLLLNKRIRTVDMVLSPILVFSVNQNNAKEVYANLLSEKWIGLDVSATVKVSNLKHFQQNLKVTIEKTQKSKQSKLILTNTEEKPKKLKKPTLIEQIQEKHASMHNLPGMKLKTNPAQNSTHVGLNKFQYSPLRKQRLVPLEASEKTALTDELTIQGNISESIAKETSNEQSVEFSAPRENLQCNYYGSFSTNECTNETIRLESSRVDCSQKEDFESNVTNSQTFPDDVRVQKIKTNINEPTLIEYTMKEKLNEPSMGYSTMESQCREDGVLTNKETTIPPDTKRSLENSTSLTNELYKDLNEVKLNPNRHDESSVIQYQRTGSRQASVARERQPLVSSPQMFEHDLKDPQTINYQSEKICENTQHGNNTPHPDEHNKTELTLCKNHEPIKEPSIQNKPDTAQILSSPQNKKQLNLTKTLPKHYYPIFGKLFFAYQYENMPKREDFKLEEQLTKIGDQTHAKRGGQTNESNYESNITREKVTTRTNAVNTNINPPKSLNKEDFVSNKELHYKGNSNMYEESKHDLTVANSTTTETKNSIPRNIATCKLNSGVEGMEIEDTQINKSKSVTDTFILESIKTNDGSSHNLNHRINELYTLTDKQQQHLNIIKKHDTCQRHGNERKTNNYVNCGRSTDDLFLGENVYTAKTDCNELNYERSEHESKIDDRHEDNISAIIAPQQQTHNKDVSEPPIPPQSMYNQTKLFEPKTSGEKQILVTNQNSSIVEKSIPEFDLGIDGLLDTNFCTDEDSDMEEKSSRSKQKNMVPIEMVQSNHFVFKMAGKNKLVEKGLKQKFKKRKRCENDIIKIALRGAPFLVSDSSGESDSFVEDPVFENDHKQVVTSRHQDQAQYKNPPQLTQSVNPKFRRCVTSFETNRQNQDNFGTASYKTGENMFIPKFVKQTPIKSISKSNVLGCLSPDIFAEDERNVYQSTAEIHGYHPTSSSISTSHSGWRIGARSCPSGSNTSHKPNENLTIFPTRKESPLVSQYDTSPTNYPSPPSPTQCYSQISFTSQFSPKLKSQNFKSQNKHFFESLFDRNESNVTKDYLNRSQVFSNHQKYQVGNQESASITDYYPEARFGRTLSPPVTAFGHYPSYFRQSKGKEQIPKIWERKPQYHSSQYVAGQPECRRPAPAFEEKWSTSHLIDPNPTEQQPRNNWKKMFPFLQKKPII